MKVACSLVAKKKPSTSGTEKAGPSRAKRMPAKSTETIGDSDVEEVIPPIIKVSKKPPKASAPAPRPRPAPIVVSPFFFQLSLH
jgi:hypothetical protein